MVLSTLRSALVFLVLIAILSTVAAQKPKPKPRATPLPEVPAEDEQKTNEPRDVDVVKTDTNLVTVPVIATDRGGLYIPDLVKEDLAITEDGVPQDIAFFAQTSAPFHVILMLDTSASTREHLQLIQKAAYAFIQQLQSDDRVKLISFDDQVRDLGDFTNDRNLLKAAINRTIPGQGTKVYDAMAMALASFGRIQGRKAIVIFTDGVDWFSDDATFNSTVRWLDEEGVIVYPIRYDTRAATERLAREQSNEMSPQLPTSDVIRPVPSGTTPTTFPSDNPIPVGSSKPTTGPLGLPTADEIWRRRRQQDPNRDPNIDPTRDPTGQPDRNPRQPPGTHDPVDFPRGGTTTRAPRPDDSIGARLDAAYDTADSYLRALAEKTGGQLLRADTLGSLPDAFAKVAAELRTQYSIGYYPINKDRDERYRKIKVSTKRKDVVIRARPGYLRTSGN